MKRLFLKVFNGYEHLRDTIHVDKLNRAFKVLRKGVDFEEGVFRVECEIVNKIVSSLSDKG